VYNNRKNGVLNMKKSINVLILLFLLAGMMFFGKRFIDTDYFKVQEVLIKGEFKLLKQDIVTKLEQMKGKNIVYLNTNEIESLIKKDARVKKVSVKKLFPSKIEVTLEEKQPYVYVKKGDETLLADKDLVIYGDILEDPSRNIPVIEYTNDESLNAIKTILSKIRNKDFYAMISEIRQSEKNYEILLINNVKIITDTQVTDKKYEDAYKLYERIKKERRVTSMDLRFIDIVVKE
jgi:FtsQ-type POTRA domain protein